MSAAPRGGFPLNAKTFHELVSGRRRGIIATAARAALWAASGPYGLAVTVRNAWYSRRGSTVHRVAAPVICVGNLTVGGTGKTPMVKLLARHLRDRGLRVALLSRGYGAEQRGVNDEALELEQSLPDVPHLQGRDRVELAKIALYEFESQVLLLDDGFQHRRLARDLDIVLLDATNPFGHGHLLPRGLLREPLSGLRRAGVVCLTRADSIEPSQREAIRRRVHRHAPNAVWCEASHRPSALINSDGEKAPLEDLLGRRVVAFCGIGNPAAFRATLEQAGADVAGFCEFPDHHGYSASDIQTIASSAAAHHAEMVVCTHKDLVKVATNTIQQHALWAVEVQMSLLAGGEELLAAVDAASNAGPPRT
ncbi:MAG: tetraacyldisaccharide 4'-kinase [Planctomycetota bacterium]